VPALEVPEERYEKGGYFNRGHVRFHPVLLRTFYPVRGLVVWAWTLSSEFRRSPARVFRSRVWELLTWPFRRREASSDYRSLRVIMKEMAAPAVTGSEKSMAPLRAGR
jgi:hypothetical protein